MRIRQDDSEKEQSAPQPIPFDSSATPSHGSQSSTFPFAALPSSAEDVFESLENMSRRIDDLARELKCLGFFNDDDDDRPRAA